jgi:membrane protein implicated in regulation of membrane protease activity
MFYIILAVLLYILITNKIIVIKESDITNLTLLFIKISMIAIGLVVGFFILSALWQYQWFKVIVGAIPLIYLINKLEKKFLKKENKE